MRRIVIPIGILLCAVGLTAQQATTPPALDLAATTLPAGFVPDDAQTVFNQFSPAKKDEFETTAQYEARVGKPQAKPLYAFSLDLGDGSQAHSRAGGMAKYDADKQQYTATFTTDISVYQGLRSDMSAWAITLKALTKSERDYEAHNAYGASTTVHERNEEIYSLVLPKKQNMMHSIMRLPFDVSTDEARDAKPYLALLVIAVPPSDGSPLVSTGMSAVSATISAPYSGLDNYYYLRLQPKSLWAYNKKTGKVYAKFDDALIK